MAQFVLIAWFLAACFFDAQAQYPGWKHSGSLFLLTTPEGANLAATASETDFPVLVRLRWDFFDFQQARPQGEDLRFATLAGAPLAYQIDQWDAAHGTASIWVRVPAIRGNDRQEIRIFWGRADALSESKGEAVFNVSNGYLSVWHMGEPVRDEAGTLETRDVGTSATQGMIGEARHLAGRQGIFGGDRITNYPSGAAAHSSEAWFRAERPNSTIFGWGNEGGGRGSKVRMQLRSPPHLHVDSDFSDVKCQAAVPRSEWAHVMHTYQNGDGRIYLNGQLDGQSSPLLNIRSPARLWLGGWYNNYDFIGDLDEVRISRVARSADWVRLQYENQKDLQTLVGPVVQPGDAFAASPARLIVAEGATATLSAQAGGAQKIYWILKAEGRETLVAVDRFQYQFAAGRFTGDRSASLQLRAVYAGGVRTQDIPITLREEIPDPVFTLSAPATWDGRQPIEVALRIANQDAMQAKGAGKLDCRWSASGIAVIREEAPGRLLLKRAQNSGGLTVSATIHNGGEPVTQSVTIRVAEPPKDEWVARPAARDEQPADNQFYARDDRNEGTLAYCGVLNEAADEVFLRVYADDQLYQNASRRLGEDRSYAFAVKLKPGLIRYRVEFGHRTGGREMVVRAVTNLVCGDAYLINGQSNAVATDWGKEEPAFRSEWIRSFGSMSGSPKGLRLWGEAVPRNREGEQLQIGYWGMELARRLVENHRIPICILNGAVGGSRIDQHQRNPENPVDMATIYGRLLWRVQQAGLTHGIRAVLWHQGENDQGADGPTGGFGWETYRQYFIDLAAAWKQDYPNLQNYYIFQIWPRSCAMGFNGSDNRLREVQRTLPEAFSRMGIMSTLGIEPPGGCHFPAAGYAELARLIAPLVERDQYGAVFPGSITPPNLQQVSYANARRDAILVEFDQPVKWDDALAAQFYLDGERGRVVAGSASGKAVTLKLAAPSTARHLTYLDGGAWSQKTLLRGENGIAALTFCDVPVLPARLPSP
jgi:hypothetical protein